MSPRPWQVSAIVFLVLTLLYWSNFKIGLTVHGFPIQAYFPQTHAAAVGQGNNATSLPPVADNPFPKVDTKKTPTTNLTKLLLSADAKKMQSELIPKENSTSPYGLKFNLQTFNQQKDWSKTPEDPAWVSHYHDIVTTTYHPCCGATISTNDCGHAIAMTGLVKKMLQDGKSDSEIKQELMLWEKYYFPRHYVIMALALQKLGKSTNDLDLSASYSSESVETAAGNYLIYD